MLQVPSVLEKPKRLEKLTKKERQDLVFDLINAFAIVKDPIDASLLVQDLLTASEIKNLSKRLGIAKLILSGSTVREVAQSLHCGFGTVCKVSAWLEESGEGFKKVVKKLPQRRKKYYPKHRAYQEIPESLLSLYLNTLEGMERQRLQSFMSKVEDKEHLFRKIQEVFDEEYKKRGV